MDNIGKEQKMETEQLKLLNKLAKDIEARQRTMPKEDRLKRLQNAIILDRNGNFTKQYKHLEGYSAK